jgi:hypothetical protein
MLPVITAFVGAAFVIFANLVLHGDRVTHFWIYFTIGQACGVLGCMIAASHLLPRIGRSTTDALIGAFPSLLLFAASGANLLLLRGNPH